MASEGPGPEDLTADGLPTARRGLDRRAVTRLLREASARWAQVQAERDELVAHIEERGGIENLTRDLREIGEHVSRMLGDAQEAAERRTAAETEAADIRQQAELDAFQMRSDAWSAGSDLLDHVRLTAAAMIEQAESDVLITRAEGEQEAHRNIAEARRQAGEITRAARNEGERAVAEARRRAEEIVGEAARKGEAVEGDDAQPTAEEEPRGPRLRAVGWGVKVIESDEEVEPTPKPGSDPHDPGYGDALAAEVEQLRAEEGGEPYPPWHADGIDDSERVVTEPQPVVEPIDVAEFLGLPDREKGEESAETEPEPEVAVDAGEEVSAPEEEPAVEESVPTEAESAPGGGILSELFERLRSGAHEVATEVAESAPVDEPTETASEEPMPTEPIPAEFASVSEAIDRRNRLLLPIHNDAMREVRRRLVDLQNEILDEIRVAKRKRWSPEPESIERPLAGALEPVVHGLIRAMAEDLFADLEGAVDRGVTGAALSEEAARVFRSWRNDVAQRWVHSITYAGYHDSLLAGLVTAGVTEVVGVRHGHVCGECPAASSATWDPAGPPPEGTKIPPAHLDCTCTVTPPA
jgi:hypothetical protein